MSYLVSPILTSLHHDAIVTPSTFLITRRKENKVFILQLKSLDSVFGMTLELTNGKDLDGLVSCCRGWTREPIA